MIKVILFDWHGVLDKRTFAGMLDVLAREWYASGRFSGEIPYDKYYEEIKRNFFEDGQRYASGQIKPENFWASLEYKGDETSVYKARNYLLGVERNNGLWDILPRLKKQYRLGVLSDCPEDKATVIRNTVDLSLFDQIYFSSDHSLLKTDFRFFNLPIRDFNVSQAECLFIDDSEKNIAYARKVGLETHLYSSVSSLEEKLLST